MLTNEIYCIDTSSIIDLFRKNSPFSKYIFDSISKNTEDSSSIEDIFNSTLKGILKKIEELIEKEVLISHELVLKELEKGKGEDLKWAKKNKKMFKDFYDLKIFYEVREMYDKKYFQAQINKTKEWADPWVITLAIAKNASIISDEKKREQNNNIPKIASYFKIKTYNLMEFFKEMKLKF